MKKFLKKIYYRLFPTYQRLELRLFTLKEAEEAVEGNINQPDETLKWWIARPEEDNRRIFAPNIYLEIKERIYE